MYDNLYLINFKNEINFIKIHKVDLMIIISFIHFLSFNPYSKNVNSFEGIRYESNEITIVSAYYKIKSKHKPRDYFDWISNFIQINKPLVFFASKKLIPRLKLLRPKELNNKTVFIPVEIEEFYSYKNFYNEFKKSYSIDFEWIHHSVSLYLIWAEKCNFMKKVITKNYFNSKCFYWIDAGYFREKSTVKRFSHNWPSTKKCFEDPRLLMGQVKNFSITEKKKILSFDYQAHIRLRKNINVIGGIFGGQINNIIKFIYLYYNTIRLFIQKGIFIGKDQNIFTYIAFSHPEIVKLIFCKNFTYYRELIS